MSERFSLRAFIFGRGWGAIPLLLAFFALAIFLFTAIFHSIYPLFEGKGISWPQSLLFVLSTVSTVGSGATIPSSSPSS